MGMFRRGYEAVREESARIEKRREESRNKLFRFFMSSDKAGKPVEAEIHFLTEAPVNFYEHTLKSMQGGKETYENVTCSEEGCPLCAEGDKPSAKGAYLIYDYRMITTKKGETREGGVKLFIQGNTVLAQLDRKSSKYGLTSRRYIVVKTGRDKSVNYSFEEGDTDKLTEKKIREMLPETLRDKYNGTENSLMAIIEESLAAAVAVNSEREKDEVIPVNDSVVSIEDEKDEEPPFTRGRLNATSASQDSPKPKLFKPHA